MSPTRHYRAVVRPRKETPEQRNIRALQAAADHARHELAQLPWWAKHRGIVLFAAAPAERLLRWHGGLPPEEQRPYSTGWQPVLDAIWAWAAGDDRAWYVITHALGDYYLSPQSHCDGQDGPSDADQDEVAATYYAANAVVHGFPDFAVLAASRATDAIDNRWFGFDDERLRVELHGEIDRQTNDLAAIVRAATRQADWRNGRGCPADLVDSLRGAQ